MFKYIKWLLTIAFIGVLLSTASYAAARVTVGKVIGPNPPLSGRSVKFAFEGAEDLSGNPRAWVINYSVVRLPRVSQATFYVSPTGKLLAVRPRDLERRIEAWERSQRP